MSPSDQEIYYSNNQQYILKDSDVSNDPKVQLLAEIKGL